MQLIPFPKLPPPPPHIYIFQDIKTWQDSPTKANVPLGNLRQGDLGNRFLSLFRVGSGEGQDTKQESYTTRCAPTEKIKERMNYIPPPSLSLCSIYNLHVLMKFFARHTLLPSFCLDFCILLFSNCVIIFAFQRKVS